MSCYWFRTLRRFYYETKSIYQSPEFNVMRCAIWYNLHNLKNVKNTHGGVLILVKLQAKSVFSRFLNCTNCTKSHNTSHIKC